MKLAKEAVAYYVDVTGQPWSTFYDKLDEAMSGDLETQSGDLWLIHSLMNVIIKNGMSVHDFKSNKDAVKAVFDDEGRKLNGEFFTPVVWAEEFHRYLDKYIPGWREGYYVWENSCYDMDTEIFTRDGWKHYDELGENDEVFTIDPETRYGAWSVFYNKFKRPYSGQMVSIKSETVDLLVTPDHRLVVDGENGKLRVLTAQELYDACCAGETFEFVRSVSDMAPVPDFWWGCFWEFIGVLLSNGSIFDDRLEVYCRGRSANGIRMLLHGLFVHELCIRNVQGLDILTVENSSFVSLVKRLLGTSDSYVCLPFDVLKPDNYIRFVQGLIPASNNEDWCKFKGSQDLVDDVSRIFEALGVAYSRVDNTDILFQVKSNMTISRHNVKMVEYDDFVWDLTTLNDAHTFLVRRNGRVVFSGNCGTGNLIRTAGITPEHLFASSLQEDDIEVIRKTPELAGCHAFQLDFLCEADNVDTGIDLFSENLPPEVLKVLEDNKPLIFLCNPPYKTGQANNTAVGRYMSCNINEYDNVNFAKPAYDLFYQFCFQVMNIVNRYRLTNCYYAVFGPLTWFTGAGANVLLKEFEKTFEFIDGMCISAQEFSDTSDSILWGIGATIWKSRGGYKLLGDDYPYHKDILLDKKFITPDGDIDCEGKVLYAPPREKLSTWVEPHDDAVSAAGQRVYPLMTSHLTFKGSEVFEKVAKKSGKMSPLALGTLMVGNTLTRSADQSAILSMPSTIQFVSIVEENFWRCVGSYAFRRTIDAGWAIAKKEISAPDTSVEGYDLWLRNALVAFLFEYKSMMSSLRGVVWEGQDDFVIQNKLFYLDEDTVRANCTDPVILKDMEEHPFQNQFMLRMIEESKPFWVPETRMVYDWCVNYTLATFDLRKTVNYKGSLECADAGFQQLRSGLWDAAKYDADLTKLIVQMRDYLRKDLEKFGFVSEVCGGDL